MIYKESGYSYNDLTIIPSDYLTDIKSRKECNPYYEDDMLPLFTAPMSCVVDEKNFALWEYYGINAILPRTVKYATRMEFLLQGKWVAFSLNEFKKLFCNGTYAIRKETILEGSEFKVCIDIANGHMKQIYEAIDEAKRIAHENGYKLIIMTGNIANPKVYLDILRGRYQVDYVRLSIGSGNGCLTSSNTGVHYPIASLIDECKMLQRQSSTYDYFKGPKIIADGGIRNYKDINIALALGADYVMVGSLFASLIESAAKTYIKNALDQRKVDVFSEVHKMFELAKMKNLDYSMESYDDLLRSSMRSYGDSIKKLFYGMSTKEAQIDINAALEYPIEDFIPKTSEGVAKMLDCKYTLRQWTENFIDYLRSAMSYTGCRSLEQFKYNTKLIVNSTTAIGSVNK